MIDCVLLLPRQSELQSAVSSDDAVKVWDMADMGFQATAHITGASEAVADSDHDPLSRLVTLTGNFPAAAKWITRLPVTAQLKADVERAVRFVLQCAATHHCRSSLIFVD
jgi:hypothetical protein